MNPDRHIWIDRSYPEYQVRVRELVEHEIKTLATFATYAQAEQHIRDLLNPPTAEKTDSTENVAADA